MKNFNMPELQVIEDVMLEPVYAASGEPGSVPSTPITPLPTGGCWEIRTEWKSHNTGHLSELSISGKHSGTTGGKGLIMDFIVRGFSLKEIPSSSGYAVTNLSSVGFTINRNVSFNPTETFDFNIQVVASDSKYEGSVGKTGEPCPYAFVVCTGYREY